MSRMDDYSTIVSDLRETADRLEALYSAPLPIVYPADYCAPPVSAVVTQWFGSTIVSDLREIADRLEALYSAPLPIVYPADYYAPPVSAVVTQWFGSTHRGIDYGTPVGTAVYAPANCVVWRTNICQKCTLEKPNTLLGSAVFNDAGWGYGWGTYVILQIEGDDLPARYRQQNKDVTRAYVIYAHLREFTVAQGDRLKAGDLLGYTGNTGNSTGPHLHLEVRVNEWRKENVIDPAKFYYAPNK